MSEACRSVASRIPELASFSDRLTFIGSSTYGRDVDMQADIMAGTAADGRASIFEIVTKS